MTGTDWERLRVTAREVMGRAYAPYSDHQMSVVALVDDDRIVVGCNVESASYGVGLYAECGLASQPNATGGGRLAMFTCYNKLGERTMSCGRCRQLLLEFGRDGLLIDTPAGVLPMSEVLPQVLGLADLDHAR